MAAALLLLPLQDLGPALSQPQKTSLNAMPAESCALSFSGFARYLGAKAFNADAVIRETRAAYNRIAPQYIERWQGVINPEVLLRLRQFVAYLPDRGPILDAGNGSGKEANWLNVETGRTVVGLDISEEMLKGSRRRFPTLLLAQGNLVQLPVGDDTLAGIWDDGAFLHIPYREAAGVLRDYFRALKPGGSLGMLVKKGRGAKQSVDPAYQVSRTFFYYEVAGLTRLAQAAGFHIVACDVQTRTANQQSPGDEWIYLIARKPVTDFWAMTRAEFDALTRYGVIGPYVAREIQAVADGEKPVALVGFAGLFLASELALSFMRLPSMATVPDTFPSPLLAGGIGFSEVYAVYKPGNEAAWERLDAAYARLHTLEKSIDSNTYMTDYIRARVEEGLALGYALRDIAAHVRRQLDGRLAHEYMVISALVAGLAVPAAVLQEYPGARAKAQAIFQRRADRLRKAAWTARWRRLRLWVSSAVIVTLSLIQGHPPTLTHPPLNLKTYRADYERLGSQAITADAIGWLIENQDVRAHLQTVPGSPRVDVIADHGWAYATWMRWALTSPSHGHGVLIHIDTHQDNRDMVALSPAPRTPEEADSIEYDIASFIWPAVLHGAVDEVYWVHNPRWGNGPSTSEDHIAWVCTVTDARGLTAPIVVYTSEKPSPEKVREKAFAGMRLTAKGDPRTLTVHIPNEPIRVHDVTAGELPDFQRARRPVIMDFDFDFWRDRVSLARHPDTRSTPSLAESIADTVQTLAQKHVQPAVVTMALSDGYTPRPDMFPIAERLTRQLEAKGLVYFSRGANGQLVGTFERNRAIATPESLAARAAFAQGHFKDVFHLTDGILRRYGTKADEEARVHPGGLNPFIFGDYFDMRVDQPAPLELLDFRELNAAGEALYLRALILDSLGRTQDAIQTMLVLKHRFSNAFIESADNDLAKSYSRGDWAFRVVTPWLEQKYAARLLRNGSWKELPEAKTWSAHDFELAITSLRQMSDGSGLVLNSPLTEEDQLRSGDIYVALRNAITAQIDRDAQRSTPVLPDAFAAGALGHHRLLLSA